MFNLQEQEEEEEHGEHSHQPAKPAGERRLLLCMVVAAGLVSGAIALAYDWAMESLLLLVWETAPSALETRFGEEEIAAWGWIYTLAMALGLSAAAGGAIKWLGFPGKAPAAAAAAAAAARRRHIDITGHANVRLQYS
jgi:hypothetical protein